MCSSLLTVSVTDLATPAAPDKKSYDGGMHAAV